MVKQYSALIVDDERLSRKELSLLLHKHPSVRVVGEADDVPSAIRAMEELQPDLIFLDVQMPGGSGFDLLERIQSDAKVIFVTAYDEYAIRAFEVNAQDYLLKPVNPERLALALDRLESEAQPAPEQLRKLTTADSIFLLLNNKYQFIRVNAIVSITAAEDYSEIVTRDGKKGLVSKAMREWEMRLPEEVFCRIHRSAIINISYIDHIEEWFNYSYRVYLQGVEKPFVMSRRYVAKIKEKLG